MAGFIIRTAINAAALVIAALVVQWARANGFISEGIQFEGLEAVLLTAVIFGLVNALIRPLVLVFTCLLNMITLGLFTLVVNALMLWLTSWLVETLNRDFGTEIGFHVDGFVAAFLVRVL